MRLTRGSWLKEPGLGEAAALGQREVGLKCLLPRESKVVLRRDGAVGPDMGAGHGGGWWPSPRQ